MNQWIFYSGFEVLMIIVEVYIINCFFNGIWEKKEISKILKWMGLFGGAVILLVTSIYLKSTGWILLGFLGVSFGLSFFYKVSHLQRIFFVLILVTILGINEILAIYLRSEMVRLGTKVTENGYFKYYIMDYVSVASVVLGVKSFQIIYLVISCIGKLSLLIEIKLILLFMNKESRLFSQRFTFLLLLFPIVGIIILAFSMKMMMDSESQKMIIFVMVMILFLIPGNIILFRMSEKEMKDRLDQQRLLFMKEEIKGQKKHYEEVLRNQLETQKQWHDMKNRLIGISGYIRKNENQKALNRIENIVEDTLSENDILYTNHLGINTLLNSKIQKGRQMDCVFKDAFRLPETLDNIDEMDLIILLGNLLDNVIEACEKLPPEERRIKFSILTKGEALFIFCQNKVPENFDINRMETTKKDQKNHGLGMGSIQSIIDKYHGELTLRCEENSFSAEIFLCIGEEK